jgi:ABC-type transport system involved in multi-copper enzyme maturation permease subunit
MPLETARYYGRQVPKVAPWRSSWAVARVTLSQLVRRKAFWIVLAVGLGQFLVYASVIYALTQMQLPPRTQAGMLERFNFSTSPDDPQDSGYLQFMEAQSLVVMILLALAGSLVIGSDFRNGVLPFYLSRRLERRHYVFGKLVAVAVIVWSLTVAPALFLYLEYGLFTTSLDYWLDTWRVVPSILGYGLVLGTVLAVWLAALSAYLQRLAPIAVTWSSLFVLLGRLAFALRDATGERSWLLLDPWRDLRLAGRMFFGLFQSTSDRDMSVYAASILLVLTVGALAALVHRVRAVEVVA